MDAKNCMLLWSHADTTTHKHQEMHIHSQAPADSLVLKLPLRAQGIVIHALFLQLYQAQAIKSKRQPRLMLSKSPRLLQSNEPKQLFM